MLTVNIFCVMSFFHIIMMCQRVKWEKTVTKQSMVTACAPKGRIFIPAWGDCFENERFCDHVLLSEEVESVSVSGLLAPSTGLACVLQGIRLNGKLFYNKFHKRCVNGAKSGRLLKSAVRCVFLYFAAHYWHTAPPST